MKLNIYSKESSLRLTIEADSNNVASCGIQEDSILSLSFSTFECVPLEVYDYIDFEGDRYWVLERYIPQMNSRRSWSYSVQLHGVPGLASQTLMVNTADADNPIFNLTAPAREHAALIIANLNRVMNTTEWKVGEVIVSEYIDIEYTGKYASDALSELSSAAGTEWWFDGMTLNISRCEFGEAIPLAYGNGLIGGITPSMAEGVKFFTRLFPVGSSRNIDPDHYGYARLQLPDRAKYVEQDTHLGLVEHFEQEAFEGIFPRRIGTVGTVRTIEKKGEDGKPFTIYYFTDPEIPFDPNDYEIGGLVKRITFQSGELRGREFEVNYESSKKEFEIITQWPYDDDTQLPSEPLVPAPGDEYILWNIRMPESYYTEAEQEFRQAVDDFMKESRKNISVFQTSTDFTVIEKRDLVLKPGRRIRLESQQMFPDTGYRETRIVSISRSISRPATMDLKLSDVLSTGRISRIEQSIEQIDRYTKQVAAEFPDIIRSWEETPPSDTTLYSSRKSGREFLNKRVGGTVEGVARFLKQLLLDEGFRTANFASGITGVGAQIDSVGAAEMESLTLRRFLEVPQLNYNRVDIAVGDEWSAPGGGVIERVDTQQQIITLRLEEGEVGSARAGDICMGIFHSSNPEQNATEDADDSRGNRRFAGFATVYFQVAEVSGEQNQTLHYERRPVSQNYAQALDPFEAMTFVCYGSFTDPARRTSRYSTRTYQRYLKGVADWEFTVDNIAAQFGDLSNLAVHGLSMSGYSAYLDNIYMQGILRNLEGNFIIDSKTQSLLMASPKSGMGLAYNPDQGLKIGAVYDPETGRFEREYDLALIEQKAEDANQKIDGLEISSVNLIDGSESITLSAGTNNYYFKRFPIGVVNSGERYALSVQTITNIEGEPVEYSVAIYDTSITTKLSYGAITLSSDKKSVVFSLNEDIVNTDAVLLLYPGIGGSTAGNTVQFDKVMFVRGDKPALSWQPSYNDQKSMADSIAQEKVDSIKIGGVNLLNDSETMRTWAMNELQYVSFEQFEGYDSVVIRGGGTNPGVFQRLDVGNIDYTASVYVFCSTMVKYLVIGLAGTTNRYYPSEDEIGKWIRISMVQKPATTSQVAFSCYAGFSTDYQEGDVVAFRMAQLEEGTKITAWKESPADVHAAISKAQQTGESAAAGVESLKSFTDDAFADGIVDRAEAAAIEKYMNSVTETKDSVDAAYTTVYNNTLLGGSAKSNLQAAKSTFDTAVADLLASIQTAADDGIATPAEKADVDSKYSTFNVAYAGFSTAIEEAQKYIQTAINATAQGAYQLSQELQGVVNNLNEAIIPDLQAQIDKQIVSYNGDEVPTLDNYPANEWQDDTERDRHINDYYDRKIAGSSGEVSYERYKFTKDSDGYKWIRIADSGAAEAQAKAIEALGVANGKNKVYFGDSTPSVPYIINDLWIKTSGDIYISNADRKEGATGSIADWQLVNDAQLRLRQMSSDNVISKEEKATLRNRMVQMQKEFASYQSDATKYGVSITALQTAYNNLTTFLTGTVAVNNDTDTTLSAEQRTTYNTYFANYDAEVSRFTNLVSDAIAQGKVDGIEIGGVNLIDGTKDFEGFTPINQWEKTDEFIGRACVYKKTGQWGGLAKSFNVEEGKKYTFSIWYRAEGEVETPIRWFSDGGTGSLGKVSPASGNTSYQTEWTRFQVTVAATTSGNIRLRVESSDPAITLYVAGYQIEEGTKATAWKESPNDVQASIDEAKKAGEEAKAQLDKWSSDSYITPTEKTGLKQQQADIRAEYNEIIAQANQYSVSTDAYTTACNKADTALTKYTADTPAEIAVGADYADIAAYYTARQTVLDAISEATKKYSEDLVDNIQIGGVNLLNGTQKFVGDNWSLGVGTEKLDNEYKDFTVLHTSNSGSSKKGIAAYLRFEYDKGSTYTISFIARGVGGIELSSNITGVISSNFELSSEWKRFSYTLTLPAGLSSGTINIIFGALTASDVYLCAVKLENGNKATSWSESQQDVRSDTEYLRELFKEGVSEFEGAVLTNAVAVKGANSEDIVAMLNGSGNFSDTAHKIAMLVLGITGGLDNWKNAPTILYGDGFIKARLGEIGILSVNGNTVEVTGTNDNRVIIRTQNISNVADAIGSSGTIPSVSTAAVSVMASTSSPFVSDKSESAIFTLAVDTLMSCSVTSSVNASGTGSANLFIDAIPTDGSDSIRIYSRGASTSTEGGAKTDPIQKMLAKGSYRIVVTVSAARSPIPEQVGGGSASANMIEYSFTASTRRNLIAPNGMAVVQSANQYAVFTGSIFEVRLGNGGFRITSTGQWQKYNSSTGAWTNVNI